MPTSYAWDVINEPFNDDGTWREDVFYDTLGESFVPIALEAARAADNSTKLYINEYNIEYAGPKATSLENLVTSLKANNTPVSDSSAIDFWSLDSLFSLKLDAVGMQCHFIVGEVPTDFQQQIEVSLQ